MNGNSWIGIVVLVLGSFTGASAQPANDDCSSATPIFTMGNEPLLIGFDLTGALDDTNGLSCVLPQDVWFQFTAPLNGLVRIFELSSAHDLAVYRDMSLGMGGCPTDADLVECGGFVDIDIMGGESFYVRVGAAQAGGSPLGTLQLMFGPDDRFVFRAEDQTVGLGGAVEVGVHLDVQSGTFGPTVGVTGWSFGVCHDPAVVDVTEVELGSTTLTINGGAQPGFESRSLFSDGFAVGVVVSLLGVNILPPGSDYEIYRASYLEVGLSETTTSLEFCGSLGVPPVPLAVVPVGGASIPATYLDGQIQIVDEPAFERGDCNDDGMVNIADVVFLGNYLFPGSGGPSVVACFDACDGNDDGSLNIADAIRSLSSLFGTPAMPLPAPSGSCGADLTMDMLGCVGTANCP